VLLLWEGISGRRVGNRPNLPPVAASICMLLHSAALLLWRTLLLLLLLLLHRLVDAVDSRVCGFVV